MPFPGPGDAVSKAKKCRLFDPLSLPLKGED